MASTSSACGNTQVRVFKDENEDPSVKTNRVNLISTDEVGKSVVRSIIDAARYQENKKEPGPWNKSYRHKKGKLFGKLSVTNELSFEIHNDENDMTDYKKTPCVPPIPIADHEIKIDKRFIYPPNFCKKSKPIKGWVTPVTSEELPDKHTLPNYNKYKLYPRLNVEFQPEELKAYNIFKKRGIQNEFTKERDVYWSCGPEYNIRMYPHFATKSKPQKLDSLDEPYYPNKLPGLRVAFDEIYNKEENVERQFEEIIALHIKCNETIDKTIDMEETMCVTSEKLNLRKSFFPMRKSLAPAVCKGLNTVAVTTEQKENEELTMSKSMANPSFNPITSKDIEYKSGDKHGNVSENKNQYEASQTELNSLVQKHFEPSSMQNVATEEVINEKGSSAFEIYEDESLAEAKKNISPLLPTKSIATDGVDYQFKTPALPVENSIPFGAVLNKLSFEILEDENFVKKSQNISKPDSSCGAGIFFDAEETCSTQTFNLFLKAQSVSTPMSIAKLHPQRQFGNILKEIVPPSISEQKTNKHHLTSTDMPVFTTEGTPIVVYSPPREQLSTILETSEQGTTQGTTHTTGATTKSTISSPEVDIDSQGQTATNPGCNQPQAVLETVKEVSCEKSIIDKIMNSPQSRNYVTINTSETPGIARLKNKCTDRNALGFVILEDSLAKDSRQVGNFSRLEKKEDTANGSVFKDLPLIRFQDDKTETISKMFITSQAKFQDDKTETISKIVLDAPHPAPFQDDKTETISQILSRPLLPNQISEDKTETISKFMLAAPEPAKFDDHDVVTKGNQSQKENITHDDFFEFFGQTPPQPAKHLINKQMPRIFDNTLDFQKMISSSHPGVLFEDTKNTSVNSNNILKDSFISDFLLAEESRSEMVHAKMNRKSKSIFRDSFIPDFSISEDSKNNQKHLENCNKTENTSILSKFSPIKNIPKESEISAQTNPQNLSMVSDFRYISGSRFNESIVKSSQLMEPRYSKNSSAQSSALKYFPKAGLEENKVENEYLKPTSNVSTISNSAQNGTTFKNILMDTFMKDFSDIKEQLPSTGVNQVITMDQPNKSNISLRFPNEPSCKCEASGIKGNNTQSNFKNASKPPCKESNLNIVVPDHSTNKSPSREKKKSNDPDDKYFELNCETEMFGTNISMIKNSTWLPNHGPPDYENIKQSAQIQEKSLHIKEENISSASEICSTTKPRCALKTDDLTQSKKIAEICRSDVSIAESASKLAAIKLSPFKNSSDKTYDDCEMSIYYKQTPKSPRVQIHIWEDVDSYKTPDENHYIHANPDHNQTLQIIENMCIDPNVNPFDVELINAFLEQHYVISYLESLPTCKLVGSVQRLRPNAKINIKGTTFDVIKLVGEGAYGAIYCGKETSTGKLVAMKQEKPPNFWEYYICLEVQERIQSDEMLQAYMSVDYALIGNNSSIIISTFSPYGSLIAVCNKIKKHTLKNVDEYVVMLLASELLEIIDHLHAVNIIHADVKADNFLLMNKITYPPTERHLQLIDFGVSIDMKLFKEGQTFSFVHNDNSFKCPEMREGRSWTYQLDLYGLAGVLHVLLFGKYMDIEKNSRGFWMHKTHIPRYLNKNLWDEIFKTLLNVRDCNSMPNLQDLRALLKKELEEREKYVLRMVNEFNRALN